MCKCEETAKAQAADLAATLTGMEAGVLTGGEANARLKACLDKGDPAVSPLRRINVEEVENGFLVSVSVDYQHAYQLGIGGWHKGKVFVAANLEAVTEIILTEGRKAR